MKASLVMILVGLFVISMAVQAQGPPQAQQNAAQAPTPRLANGKPDLTGNWGGGNVGPPGGGNRRCGPTQTRGKVPNDNFVVDYAWISPSRYWMGANGPVYKPEYWDRVQWMDKHGNQEEPREDGSEQRGRQHREGPAHRPGEVERPMITDSDPEAARGSARPDDLDRLRVAIRGDEEDVAGFAPSSFIRTISLDGLGLLLSVLRSSSRFHSPL